MTVIHVRSMEGIGDNLYARPFIKMLGQSNEVYLTTPLPGLFYDLPVKFLKPEAIKYRTQKKDFDVYSRVPEFFSTAPTHFDREITFGYNSQDLKKRGIIRHVETRFGFETGSTAPIFDLPPSPRKIRDDLGIPPHRKVAVVRPVTERREWFCSSRNCNENYVGWCARVLREQGYYVISIADLEDDVEWVVGSPPPADLTLHRGELTIIETVLLLREVDLVVGAPGFIIPAAICAGTPLFIIFGGRGAYDNPHNLLDLRLDLKKIGWAMPDNFCRCNKNDHECDKTISNLDHQFYQFMSRL